MLLLHSTYLKAQRRRRQSIDKRFACSWCCCCCQWRGRGKGRVPIGLGYPLHYKSNGTKQNKRNGIVSNWQASRGGAHNPPSPPSHPPVRPGRWLQLMAPQRFKLPLQRWQAASMSTAGYSARPLNTLTVSLLRRLLLFFTLRLSVSVTLWPFYVVLKSNRDFSACPLLGRCEHHARRLMLPQLTPFCFCIAHSAAMGKGFKLGLFSLCICMLYAYESS